MNHLTLVRVGIICAIVVLVAPVAIHATTYEDDLGGERVNSDFGGRDDTLFVTTQGTETLNGSEAKATAINTTTGEVVWSHTRYERYFDVEPLSDERILFLGADGPRGANMWVNIVNWRTGETLYRFRVPDDVHDVDHVGGDRYAVADIENDRVFVYDEDADEVVWQYRFRDRFPPEVGGDEDDYTHLNDVDVFDNGSTFLVSPRNFDRGMLLNRTEKRIEWTLGEEDNYDILYEQHNPSLISRNPQVVLVADSENDRVVEYRKNGSEWEQVWAYRGSLTWPREADRLPNGNTLIVDSNGQRVLEVTPGREVVWEITVTKNPYDADLLSLGDEPVGPSMLEFQQEFDGPGADTGQVAVVASRLTYPVQLLQWVVPWNIQLRDFVSLLVAVMLGTFMTGGEIHRWRSSDESGPVGRRLSNGTAAVGFGVVAFGVGGYLLAVSGADSSFRWMWQGIGLLTAGVGVMSMYEGKLGRSSKEPVTDSFTGEWGPTVVGVLCAFGAVGLAVATGWIGLNLGIATVFALEALRNIPSSEFRNPRWLARGYALVSYGGRTAALAPAAVLVATSTGESYEIVYLGLSILLLCSAIAPRSRTALDSLRTTFGLRAYVLAGIRTVSAAGAVAAIIGLVYLGLQSTRLSPVYFGLTIPLVRIGSKLLSTVNDRR